SQVELYDLRKAKELLSMCPVVQRVSNVCVCVRRGVNKHIVGEVTEAKVHHG
ncbi:putative RNA pseudouridine synthase RP544, partial [Dissostichus eleginoides]